jgi:hypothetical protein
LEILNLAVERLGPLVEEIVFLGGCAVGLLLTDPAAPPVRVTVDVDVIAEVGSLADYYALADRLRQRGFVEDQSEGAPICRWSAPPVLLDVMPTRSEIMGFGNPWYAGALEAAELVRLPSGMSIRLVTAPYFLATKLAAFASRGTDDYVMSHDLEDVVVVIDGRPQIVEEVAGSEPALHGFLAASLKELAENARFVAALPGFLPGDAASQARQPLLLERIRAIAGLD